MEPERAAGDQPQLGIHLFDPGVAEPVLDRRFDPGSLFGDRAGELDERRQTAPSGPGQPGVEQRDRFLERDVVDLAQLLGEKVGAVEPLVELLDAGELQLLALGQVARVLPQREPDAFELFGELRLALRDALTCPGSRA